MFLEKTPPNVLYNHLSTQPPTEKIIKACHYLQGKHYPLADHFKIYVATLVATIQQCKVIKTFFANILTW